EVGEVVLAPDELRRERLRELRLGLDREALPGDLVQLADQAVRARRPRRRVSREELADQLVYGLGDRLAPVARRDEGRPLLGAELLAVVARERRRARRDRVEERAERPEVGAAVGGVPLEHLGGGVARALDPHAERREPPVDELRRLARAASRDEDRLGRERAV